MKVFWVEFRGSRVRLRNGESTVGRSEYCTIAVDNDAASRQHAALRVEDGRLIVVDLGSRNGTTVNGETITGARRVLVGDVIGVGSDRLVVVGAVRTKAPSADTVDERTGPGTITAPPPEES